MSPLETFMKHLLSGWRFAPTVLAALFVLSACESVPVKPQATEPVAQSPSSSAPKPRPKPVVALALGGGGAKGFAHIGVIKALEAQGIQPDIVIGTSAGSVIGALYAAGLNGFELQELAIPFEDASVKDFVLPDRGLVKGESLARFVNTAVRNQPIEKLSRKFGAVATRLSTGDAVVFRTGDTGTAVRASSSVPVIFRPVAISGAEYVDGGLVSPVPVSLARQMGATFVIAVDISDVPSQGKTGSTVEVVLQSLTIMGRAVANADLPHADVVIRPDIRSLSSVDFKSRHLAILEGEKAVARELADLKARLAQFPERPVSR
jgi:NTE family protein